MAEILNGEIVPALTGSQAFAFAAAAFAVARLARRFDA
jgi:hypothetical protein